MLNQIRWRRVLLAALLSEVGVIALLLAIVTVYSRLIRPDVSGAEYQELGQRIGYYVAPAAGAVMIFLMVLWVGRRLEAGFVANGVMVGVVSVVLTSGFFLAARPEDRAMYGVAFALRIVAGYLGGLAAQRRAGQQTAQGAARRPLGSLR